MKHWHGIVYRRQKYTAEPDKWHWYISLARWTIKSPVKCWRQASYSRFDPVLTSLQPLNFIMQFRQCSRNISLFGSYTYNDEFQPWYEMNYSSLFHVVWEVGGVGMCRSQNYYSLYTGLEVNETPIIWANL